MAQPEILWSNQRLERAVAQLVFYSEILPKQIYLDYKAEREERAQREKSGDYRALIKEIGDEGAEEDLQKKLDQMLKCNPRCLDEWDHEYVARITGEYQSLFKTFYKDKIMEKIFRDNVNTLTKAEFLDKICPPA